MPGPDHELGFLEALKGVGPKPVVLPTLDSQTTSVIETVNKAPEEHTTSVPAAPATVTAANLWRHPDAHPIVLDLLMLNRFGPAWLEWSGESLRTVIPEDFKTQSVSELNITKLQACKTLHLVDSFWQRWEVFIACLMPFNSEFPDFRTMPVPTVAQCLVAVDVATNIRTDVDWSSEMKAYFSVVYKHDGIFKPLPPLGWADVEMPEGHRFGDLCDAWDKWRVKSITPTGDTFEEEQVRRLLAARAYLEESRARLKYQLKLHAQPQ
jgi:hypothetical protein